MLRMDSHRFYYLSGDAEYRLILANGRCNCVNISILVARDLHVQAPSEPQCQSSTISIEVFLKGALIERFRCGCRISDARSCRFSNLISRRRFSARIVAFAAAVIALLWSCPQAIAPAAAQPAGQPRLNAAMSDTCDSYNPGFIHKFLSPGRYMPLSEVKAGMTGYGLTVFQGTKIERFNVQVIGVVKKVLNGRDAILVKMSGGKLVNNNVIRGMSGSPVYLNEKLVGAISFGFDFAKEPLAGVTPIVDMLDAMVPEKETGNRIAGTSGSPWFVSSSGRENVSAGAPHLTPLMSPVALTGFSSGAEEFLRDRLKPYGMDVTTGGAGALDPTLAAGAPAVPPGGSVSVMLATGDFNVVATGTVTARFGNKVLAFGHPFLQAGAVDFPLATAYVHEVISSLFVSMKLASPVSVIGSFTSDRPWSVSGQVGRSSRLIPAKFVVTDLTRSIKRTYRCNVVDHPDLTPELLASTAMSAIDSTHQSNGPYVARVESLIQAEGLAPIRRTDRFSSNFSAHRSIDSGRFRFLADPVGSFVLRTTSEITNNDFVKASITGVELNITLDDGHKTANLDKVFLDKSFVAPGEQVDVHCLLKPYNGADRLETLTVKVPRDMPDGNMLIGVSSGDEINAVKKRLGIVDPTPENLTQIGKRILDRGRGDAIQLVAALPSQSLVVGGTKLADLPAYWAHVFLSNKATRGPSAVKADISLSKPTDWLIDGSHILTVEIRSPEKVRARSAPYTMSVPSRDETITITEQAKKAIDSVRKTSSSTVPAAGEASSTGQQKSTDKQPAAGSTGARAGSLKDYPHMRPVRIWRQDSDEDFRSGKTNGTTVDSWGRLSPGFQESGVQPIPREPLIWSGVWSRGYFWYGVADQLYRWAGGDSRPEPVAKLAGIMIAAMAADSKGTVYAASVPGGQIWEIDGSGKARPFCAVPEQIPTSLCVDDKDNLFVGVAQSGKVYKVDATRTVSDFFASNQSHVLSLFFSPHDRKLYVGCGENGVVYAVDAGGKATAVCQTPDHFVTGAVKDSRGDLYVATAASGRLVRITASGDVQALATSEAFYKLLYDPATDSVFTGDAEGDITVCKVDPVTGQSFFFPICHTEQEEVLALAADDKKHLFAGTSNLAVLREFDMSRSKDANYESAIKDAGLPATWIAINAWGPDNEPNAAISRQVVAETRTGDSAQPDETWSGWQDAQYKDGAYAISSRPARYLQYRLKWPSAAGRPGDEAIKLGRLEVSYLPRDSAPKFNSISVKPDTPVSGKVSIAVSGSDPDADNLLLSIDISADGGKTWKPLVENVRTDTKMESKPEAAGKPRDKGTAKSPPGGGSSEGSKQKSDEQKPAALKGGVQHDEESNDGLSKGAAPGPIDARRLDEGNSGNDSAKRQDEKDEGKAQEAKGQEAEKKQEPARKAGRASKPVSPMTGSTGQQADRGSTEQANPEEKMSWLFDTTKHKDGNYMLKFTLDDRLSSPEDHMNTVALRAITVANKPPALSSFTSSKDAAGALHFSVQVESEFAPIVNATYRIDSGDTYCMAGLTGLTGGTKGRLVADGIAADRGAHKVEIRVTDSAGNSATRSFNL